MSRNEATTYIEGFGDAMALLCGKRPPDDMLAGWLADDERLQQFACAHGPAWAQGIAVIDAARILAGQPVEGERHEAELPVSATRVIVKQKGSSE